MLIVQSVGFSVGESVESGSLGSTVCPLGMSSRILMVGWSLVAVSLWLVADDQQIGGGLLWRNRY